MKKLICYFCLLCSTSSINGQTLLEGKITAEATGEEMIGANIIILQKEIFKVGIVADFDGNYVIELDPGIYDVEVSYVGYINLRIEGVIVEANQKNKMDVSLSSPKEGLICDLPLGYPIYYVPLIDHDPNQSGETTRAEKISKLPTKNIRSIGTMAPGVSLGN